MATKVPFKPTNPSLDPDLMPDPDLDEDDPLWLINAQITDLMEGFGASEDHRDVISFLRQTTGLPEKTVRRIHRAICTGSERDEVAG